ncbi:MAG: PhzF family phenazine biosynthesis protein [Nitrospina sp.]|nr:PhzF family phenazine biosynthesis protein [Nitrospina sp.]
MEISFYQVDVFTKQLFGGNPLAVFPQAQDFKEEDLQKVAREMNLSETTFVYPSTSDEADFDVRIFTPTCEIPFAGHPTLGTAYVLRENGLVTKDKNPLRLNFKAGIIPVWTEEDKGFMQHPPAKFLQELERSEKIAQALGLGLEHLDGRFPIQVVSTGFPALLVPVISLDKIREIGINTQTLHEVLEPLGIDMVYAFTTQVVHSSFSLHSRAFAPSMGIPEDPATGSVSGAVGAYLAKYDVIEKEKLGDIKIEQGYEMKRPSSIYVQVTQQGSEIQKIRVGGQTQPVFTGRMNL